MVKKLLAVGNALIGYKGGREVQKYALAVPHGVIATMKMNSSILLLYPFLY